MEDGECALVQHSQHGGSSVTPSLFNYLKLQHCFLPFYVMVEEIRTYINYLIRM